MDEPELKVTPTNSINESKGEALRLEGNQSMYIVTGILGFVLMMIFGNIAHWPLFKTVLLSVIPLVLSGLYVYIFHYNKPPGYQEDIFNYFLEGGNDDVNRSLYKANPYLELKMRVKK